MASPTTAITRLDLSLNYQEFSNALNRRKFIGHLVFPLLQVGKQSSDFVRIKIASVLGKIIDTLRAPKTGYKRGDFEWAKDNYSTDDHGLEEELDDRQLKMYPEIVAEVIHRDRAINGVVLAYENDCAGALFDTAVWTGASLTTAIATAWSDKVNADPVADIDAAKDKVLDSCGHVANAFVASEKAFRSIMRTDRMEDLVKYSGRDDPKVLAFAQAAFADQFKFDHVLIADSPVKNTADEGQSPVFGRIWDETMAMVCRITDATNLDLEPVDPHVGRTLMWNEDGGSLPGVDDDSMGIGVLVEEYREEGRRGSVIRARNDRKIKILHKEAGHLLTAVTA